MRRKTFLELIGLSVDNLKNLVRRGALPLAPDDESESTPSEGWRDYSARDVVQVVIALRLAGSGLTQEEASAIVVRFSNLLRRWADNSFHGDCEIWFGVAEMIWDDGGVVVSGALPVAGPLDGLILSNKSGETFKFSDVAHSCKAHRLVNVTGIVRELTFKASELGLDEDFSTVLRRI